MPKYAQMSVSGVVHTITETNGTLKGPGIVEVVQYDVWYIGAYYDGANFMRLQVEPGNGGQVTINTPLNITVRWVDIQDQTVVRSGTVKVICGNHAEVVAITDGIGTMQFSAAEPGDYLLVADSPEGCRAVGRVVVE